MSINNNILHILPDEKFSNGFIFNQKRYAAYSNNTNHYQIVSERTKIKNILQNEDTKVFSISEMTNFLKLYATRKYDHIIFHSLPGRFRKNLLRNIPKPIPVTWIFYGYEYYHRRDIIRKYMGPVTKSFYNSRENPHYLLLASQRLLDWFRNESRQFRYDLQRIDRFAHWNPEEYKMIRDQYQLNDMAYLPFFIGLQVHKVVPDNRHHYLLLGHSGSLTVNHLDGIEALDKHFLDHFDRILIPFSYGANKSYEDKVRKIAEDKMKDKVIFMKKFMNRSSYFNLLSRVKVAWMPQIRAMGGGNILFCLKNNIPVVLPSESLMYQYYITKGIQVFAMEETRSLVPLLSEAQKKQNQKALEENFGRECIRKQYRNLLSPF